MIENQQSRIPAALQSVFLASNRGHHVDLAPPEKVASKVFFRNWLLQRKRNTTAPANMEKSHAAQSNMNMNKKDKKSLPRKSLTAALSPQLYFDAMIRSRGYPTSSYKTLNTAYYNKPSPLQIASYSKKMIDLVRTGNAVGLDELLSAGLSSNPCNGHGESILHMVCRHGNSALLKVMLKHGADVRLADDYGRTPLHDACWSANPAFEVFNLLVERDHHLLFMQDKRGCLPLSYIRNEHWAEWNEPLSKIIDLYWPVTNENVSDDIPELALRGPNSRVLPDPPGALPIEFAEMVASGSMAARDAMSFLRQCGLSQYDSPSDDTLSTDDDSDDEYDETEWGTESGSTEMDGADEEELIELMVVHASLVKSRLSNSA